VLKSETVADVAAVATLGPVLKIFRPTRFGAIRIYFSTRVRGPRLPRQLRQLQTLKHIEEVKRHEFSYQRETREAKAI
jgi:hypothetical protein